MRWKIATMVALAASLSMFGIVRAADHPSQDNQAAQDNGGAQDAQAQPDPAPQGMNGGMAMGQQAGRMRMQTMRRGMAGPQGMRGPGPIMIARFRNRDRRGGMLAGLLGPFTRMQDALDNPRVRARLKLTDQQVTSLRKIILDAETYTITTGANIAVNGIQERELLREDSPDRGAVMSKGDAISKDVSGLIQHLLSDILQVKAVLTPAQQQMIREYMANRGRRTRMPMGMRMRPPRAGAGPTPQGRR